MPWMQATVELSEKGFRQSVVEPGREDWTHPDGRLAILKLVDDEWEYAIFPADVVHCR